LWTETIDSHVLPLEFIFFRGWKQTTFIDHSQGLDDHFAGGRIIKYAVEHRQAARYIFPDVNKLL